MKTTYGTLATLVVMDCPHCEEEIRQAAGAVSSDEESYGERQITKCPYCKKSFEYYIE